VKTLVLVNSADPVPHRRVDRSVFETLNHLGIFYEVLDLARTRLADYELRPVHLLVIGQEGIGRTISDDEFAIIIKRVSQGLGLVIFDGYLQLYPAGFLRTLGVEDFTEEKTTSLTINADDWIGRASAQTEVPVKQPLSTHPVRYGHTGWQPFLFSEHRRPTAAATRLGKGKVVLFSLSAGVWQDEFVGHTNGLDGVFWRALAWAARKPFVMKAMPPFLAVRIDDVSGENSPVAPARDTVERLHYLEALNRHGITPAMGVFTEDISEGDAATVRERFLTGAAEFSAHAFTDPRNENEFPVYLKHSGREFTAAEMQDHFSRLDRTFGRWGVQPAKTLNAHFGEVGIQALPFLKERKQRYLMNVIRVGKAYADPKAHQWELKPYGDLHFSFDSIPEDRDFFQVLSLPGLEFSAGAPDFDFLCGCTPFWKENPHTDTDKAIRRGTAFARRGLENMFFGSLLAHEQRIAFCSPGEWETIVNGIMHNLSGLAFLPRSYDYISAYAENRLRYEIVQAECTEGITLVLKGASTQPQLLYLFLDGPDELRQSFLEIPAFEKSLRLNFRI